MEIFRPMVKGASRDKD